MRFNLALFSTARDSQFSKRGTADVSTRRAGAATDMRAYQFLRPGLAATCIGFGNHLLVGVINHKMLSV